MEHVFPSNKNEPLFRCCSLRQEEPPIFLHFPSPFLDDISATQLQPQDNLFGDPNKPLNITTHDHELNGRFIGTEPTPEIKPKKMKRSSGKKDRHSKIHTAHGLRGRRMRLSIHIARKFFDLQDMLGFDKASKTLDWLFSNSKKAIKELTQTHPSEMGNIQSNSTGERGESTLVEFESGLMENITAKTKARKGSGASIRESLMVAEREPRKSRKYAINSNDPVARESREKARARARERTIEKMMIKCKEEKSKRSEWLEANTNATNCLEKQSLGFTANPNGANYLDKEGSGFTANPNNTDMNKLGSPKNHFEPPNSHGQDTNFALEHKSSAALGRLEFNTKSLNFLENRGARNSRMKPDSSMAPITPIIEVHNPSCILDLLVTTTNINFHSQHLQERSVQFP